MIIESLPTLKSKRFSIFLLIRYNKVHLTKRETWTVNRR